MRKRQISIKPKAIIISAKGTNLPVHSSKKLRTKKSMHATLFMGNMSNLPNNPSYG